MTRAELREKVAQAMFAKSGFYHRADWDGVTQITRNMWLNDADAALRVVAEALREPDEAMRNVGTDEHPIRSTSEVCHIWRAMLAASPLMEGTDG